MTIIKKHNHFNTSHVSINRRRTWKHCGRKSDFNTSHVSINQEKRLEKEQEVAGISIHLMFLLIGLYG